MNAFMKIIIGALMVVLGVYSSVTFWGNLVALVQASIGPLLILVGAFIVWLETDEWKMERQEKKDRKQKQGLQREFQPQKAVQKKQTTERNFDDVLSGTVDEVKNAVRNMPSPDYRGLYEAEKQGKNRKTVKEFLERRID